MHIFRRHFCSIYFAASHSNSLSLNTFDFDRGGGGGWQCGGGVKTSFRVVMDTIRRRYDVSAIPTMYTNSGGASALSAVKEPGHFEVRKSPSQVTQMRFFSSKKVGDFLAVRSGNIFIFFSHYYRSKAIRRAKQGLSQGGGSSSQVI